MMNTEPLTGRAPVLARPSEYRNDPRRPGRLMIALWCMCGRFYTVTLSAVASGYARGQSVIGCPDPDCGRGIE